MQRKRTRTQTVIGMITALSAIIAISTTSHSAESQAHMLWSTKDAVLAGSALASLGFPQDVGNLKSGDMIVLTAPNGLLSKVKLGKVTTDRFGGISLQGVSADGRSRIDLVIKSGHAFGNWKLGAAQTFAIYSSQRSGQVILNADSHDLLASRLEAQTLINQGKSLPAGPVVMWVSPVFENRYGLASAARMQYLVKKINDARLIDGQEPIELVASRKTGKAESNDPVMAASGVSVTAAKPLVADEDLALAAAVLPSSRSVKTGVAATAFATIINPGASEATACGLVMNGSAPAGVFHFQETDEQNQPVGTQDANVNIAGNAGQSYVFSFSANSAQSPGLDLPIEFSCSNRKSAQIISGLNALFFSASDTDVPDIIAVSETGSAVGLNTDAGIVDMIDRASGGAFVVATANVGVTGDIVVSASSSAGAALPVSLLVCQTAPATGACLASPAAQVLVTIGAGETPSFAFFTNSDTVWPFDPANNRVNVTFKQDGAIRGSTSIALRTLQGTPELPVSLIDYEAIAQNLPDHFTQPAGLGPNQITPLSLDNTPVDNPVTNAGATLGRVLFYDKRLSINDTVSCSSCHEQARGFSDPDILSSGFEGGFTRRHSMGLANARFYGPEAFFWDERAPTLEHQVLMPIQDGVEMGMTLDVLLPKLQAVDFYPALFTNAFGDSTITSDRISKALAQFVRSLISVNSKFDQAYYNGTVDNPDFAGTLTSQELEGLNLFTPAQGSGMSSLRCAACHATTAQTLDAAQNNGLDANTDSDQGAGGGTFKAPSLRNIAVRGPYMHDGRFATLEEVIEFYNSGVQDHPNLSPRLRDGGPNGDVRRLNLSSEQKAALLAFLNTLTDEGFLTDTRFADPFNKR